MDFVIGKFSKTRKGNKTKAKKGRPKGSKIKDRIKAILEENPKLHPWGIYKKYKEKFPGENISSRLVYYHLNQLEKEGFKINKKELIYK